MDTGTAALEGARLFGSHDVQGIRKLHSALVTEIAIKYDEGLWRLCLITYVLSKILSKPRYWKGDRNQIWSEVGKRLQEASELWNAGKKTQAQKQLVMVYRRIESADEKDRRYIKTLFGKAALKAASTFYAKGLSLGRSAELTGLDKHEVLSYTGQTAMHERVLGKVEVEARMRRLRALFG